MDTERLSSRTAISRRQLLGFALGGTMMLATALAAPMAQAADPFIIKCHGPTPSTSPSNYPGSDNIILSNNLARPAGKPINAPGQLLHISGRVTDENCVPIANAMVDLWQVNPFGKYRWASRDELLNPEPVFAGNGRAVTDNMGRFQFTTLFPGEYGRYAPHVNFRVHHSDFNTLNTTMYFRGDRRNDSDSRFNAFKSDSQARLLSDVMMRDPNNANAGLEATFNIVVKGSNPFRRF
jgi:protocatechuate 3,4-dioxygenase, beta subunit